MPCHASFVLPCKSKVRRVFTAYMEDEYGFMLEKVLVTCSSESESESGEFFLFHPLTRFWLPALT